jgi:predicted DCC family thiol-disulfide oxidoreductase YuxK
MQPEPMDARASGPQGWVLYDGGCGVCAKWVPFWGPTMARLGLAVAPLQEPWVAARVGVPTDALLTDIRLLFRDGRQLAGADVYRYVMQRLWWAYPLYLVAAAPGLRRLFDRAYRAFADHRHRISRACGLDDPGGPGRRGR